MKEPHGGAERRGRRPNPPAPFPKAEGGAAGPLSAGPVLGRLIKFAPCLSWAKSVSLHEEQEGAH
jgi:hypothetical protein